MEQGRKSTYGPRQEPFPRPFETTQKSDAVDVYSDGRVLRSTMDKKAE